MISRRRTIRFKPHATGAAAAEITRAVLAIAGVQNADYNNSNLSVNYHFPETTLAAILQVIAQGNTGLLQVPGSRLTNHILAFMEENERDYLTYSCGWHRYLEDIYRQHFDTGAQEKLDARKQTWRKYK